VQCVGYLKMLLDSIIYCNSIYNDNNYVKESFYIMITMNIFNHNTKKIRNYEY